MATLNRNKIKTITLWIGIITALLLIFGTFSLSAESNSGQEIFSWLFQTEPLVELRSFATSTLESFLSSSF